MPKISDIKATWDNVATTFTAVKMDVTDTNSASDSKIVAPTSASVIEVYAECIIRKVG